MTTNERPPFCPACGHNLEAEQPVAIGALSFDPRRDAVWGERAIRLTSAQFLIFGSIVQARGSAVSLDVLAERSGYDGHGDAHDVVQVLVCRIRGALRAAGAPPTIIRTIRPRGRGYALDVGLLRELEAENDNRPAVSRIARS